MISTVLVPMDDSEMAVRALRYALTVHPEANITVVHVAGEPSSMMGRAAGIALADDPEAAADELAADLFERVQTIAAEHETTVDTLTKIGHPARVVINMSEGFDTVVIGSHGGSLADRLLVGNVAEQIVRRSAAPVTVVR